MILRQTVTELFDCLLDPFDALLCSIQLHCAAGWKEAKDVISSSSVRLIVPDEAVKFRDPGLNRSRELRLEAVRYGNFGRLFTIAAN